MQKSLKYIGLVYSRQQAGWKGVATWKLEEWPVNIVVGNFARPPDQGQEEDKFFK